MSKPTEEITAQILCAAAEGQLLAKCRDGKDLGEELATAFKALYFQVLACQVGEPVADLMQRKSQ